VKRFSRHQRTEDHTASYKTGNGGGGVSKVVSG